MLKSSGLKQSQTGYTFTTDLVRSFNFKQKVDDYKGNKRRRLWSAFQSRLDFYREFVHCHSRESRNLGAFRTWCLFSGRCSYTISPDSTHESYFGISPTRSLFPVSPRSKFIDITSRSTPAPGKKESNDDIISTLSKSRLNDSKRSLELFYLLYSKVMLKPRGQLATRL